MKRGLQRASLLIGLFGLILLAACSSHPDKEKEVESTPVKIQIDITKNQGAEQLATKKIKADQGMSLYTIMKENFDIEDEEGFITSIDGVSQNASAGEYWLFEINGEMSTKGAKDVQPKDGDQISWDLHGN
ncbi:DUF4430 domain-containing protein [Listeria costaricensis]|uniref:DUF4430 domain-containing protein n=1 Tax=Listeria costaricensis TaxID=2026604 RepID=UPI000C086217|nr:DUF4430 domain-containing protein [Listeria costaricensis]